MFLHCHAQVKLVSLKYWQITLFKLLVLIKDIVTAGQVTME